MKRVDLHVQFEGSINITLINKLISDESRKSIIKKNVFTLEEYQDGYNLPIKLLQTRENLMLFTNQLLDDLISDGIIYAEIHLCPFNFASILSAEEALEAIIESLHHNKSIKTRLVLNMKREFTLDKNLGIVKLAKMYRDDVVALSLIGDEERYKTATFKQLFDIIRIDNIPFMLEAHELESIDLGIKFGASRIMNCPNIINNLELMTRVRNNNIFIELSPSYLLDTRICQTMDSFPIKEIVEYGINCILVSHSRTLSNTTLSLEYQLLKDNFKFTNNDFIEFNLNAIEASFLGQPEKAELIYQIKSKNNVK